MEKWLRRERWTKSVDVFRSKLRKLLPYCKHVSRWCPPSATRRLPRLKFCREASDRGADTGHKKISSQQHVNRRLSLISPRCFYMWFVNNVLDNWISPLTGLKLHRYLVKRADGNEKNKQKARKLCCNCLWSSREASYHFGTSSA